MNRSMIDRRDANNTGTTTAQQFALAMARTNTDFNSTKSGDGGG